MNALSAWHRCSLCTNCLSRLRASTRNISTFSAIGKALRESREPLQRKKRRSISKSHQNDQQNIGQPPPRTEPRSERARTSSRLGKSDAACPTPITKRAENDLRKGKPPGERDGSAGRRLDNRSDSYWGIPYTTAASEFLFGYSTVMAALKAKKRKLYKLYLHERAIRRDTGNSSESLLQLATESNLVVKRVNDGFLSVMDKKVKDRPHNGLILEASPLPIMPVMNLSTASRHNSEFALELDFQSAEEKAINGTHPYIPQNSATWRNPFVLFLYEVKNEGNLGAIIRTAYFLGVDAIAIHGRATASLSSGSALKASSGAAEALPFLRVGNVDTFLRKSADAGWRIFASVAPSALRLPNNTESRVAVAANSNAPLGFSSGTSSSGNSDDVNESLGLATALDPLEASADDLTTSNSSLPSPSSPLLPSTFPFRTTSSTQSKRPVPLTSFGNPTLYNPSILVLGGEHEGVSRRILSKCHTQVCIESARAQDEIGVDSLNVSVAAGLLIQKFVQRPKGQMRVGIGEKIA